MVPSLFHRHAHTSSHVQGSSDFSSQPPTYRSGMAMTGLAAFSSSGLPPRPNIPCDNLAFVPYTAPIRPREAQAMGDLSYELAHPSKFSDWTDDGDEHALPPPSLGIALLSKARAAIKASREAVTSKHHDEKVSGLPSASGSRSRAPTLATRSRAPTLAPSSLSGFRSRGPTIVNPPVPMPQPESPIHRWLDLGASFSSPASLTGIRQSPAIRNEASPRVTAFQFLEGANQLSSPSRIRRQTDIANTAQSYSNMMQAQEKAQQASFINRYPDFEVAPNQAGPSRLPMAPLGRAFEPLESPRTKARRTTTSSVLRTWDQAEVMPADNSLHHSGTQKSSSSKKGRESLFPSFKKTRSRNGKARAEDVGPGETKYPVDSARSSQNQGTATRRSLPPVRGLRNMFSMEPVVHADTRPSQKIDGLPPGKPLPPAPNEFGVMIRPRPRENFAQTNTPAFVSLNSPPATIKPLPSKMLRSSNTPPPLTTSHLRQLTNESTLVGSVAPEPAPAPSRELGSPMATPPRSPLTNENVSPFSTAFQIMGDTPVAEMTSFLNMEDTPPAERSSFHEIDNRPDIAEMTSFLNMEDTPEPSPANSPGPSKLSPAKDDISVLDPDQSHHSGPSSPTHPSAPDVEPVIEADSSINISVDLIRSPTPETETDKNASPRTKRVRSLTDMRNAFRRMQAFTGLEVSECGSRRTSTTVGGDGSGEDKGKVDDDGDDWNIHDVVVAHIRHVNLVLASPVVEAPADPFSPIPPAKDDNKAEHPAEDSTELVQPAVDETKMVPSDTGISTQSSAMVTAPSHQSTRLNDLKDLDDRSLPSAGDLAGDVRNRVPRALSGRSFYTALDDIPDLPRSLSKSSSLGALSTRNTSTNLLENIEKREGSGWWSDSSKEIKVQADEIVDKRLAALEDKVKSSPSPFKSIRSSHHTPLADDATPRTSMFGHAPRMSLVGDSTWSQGEDGSPVRITESPRRARKRRETRIRKESNDSPIRHVRDPSSASSLGEGLPTGLTTLKSPFARKVSPDIARRAGLITHAKQPSHPSRSSPTRRRGHIRAVGAGPSRRSDDEVDVDAQSSTGSQSGSEMSSLCKLELELGTSVRKRGKEIDTLITTLTETQRENLTLRSQVVHKHAIMGDMLEERQEMKDEMRQLRQQLAKVEREVISPVRSYGSVRDERSPFRGTPEPLRRSSLARLTPASRGYSQEDSFIDRYRPDTPTRRSMPSRSPIGRHLPSARSDVSFGTSAGVSIRSSPSSRA